MSVITTPAGPIDWQILAIFQDPTPGSNKKYCLILWRDNQGHPHFFNHVPFPFPGTGGV